MVEFNSTFQEKRCRVSLRQRQAHPLRKVFWENIPEESLKVFMGVHYFFFEERTLVQESIHLGEQLTSTFNDCLDITLGLEYEFRFALAGKNQTYRINGTPTDYTDGSFSENSGSGNLGLSYRFGWFGSSKSRLNQGLAYIQLSSRLSDKNRVTYGGSVGLNF